MSITFRAVSAPWSIIVISDSAFQSDDQDCLALRSGIIALASKTAVNGKYEVQPVEFLCKKQNHVCRSTYAAEIHSALDLVGLGMLIQSTITEVLTGTLSALELLEVHNNAGHAVQMHLFIDAKAVYDSITARNVKTPADKILLLHALALRDHLDHTQIASLSWIDTRDMVADALNKGKVDRTAIRDFFEKSMWHLQHEARSWQFGDR